MPAVNGVGEPCAGKPHARFDAAGAGNGAGLIRSTGVAQPTGKPAEHEGPRLYRQRVTAPAPDPTRDSGLTGVPTVESAPDLGR
jgi:hypothetical protein